MEIQIKKAVKAGNSSAVILPRSWLNKEVRIELVKKSDELILIDILNIIKNKLELNEVIGVYLTGSYARGEKDENSDIDILVITKNIDLEMITEGIYNIFVISSELLDQKLNNDLFPIGQMIKEAKPLLNKEFFSTIKIEVSKKNVNWYLETTWDKLILIRKIINRYKEKNKEYLNDRIVYTLILRIRTFYIIRLLLENKKYSKKDFVNLIGNLTKNKEVYQRYLSYKNNLREESKISVTNVEKLLSYLENEYLEISDKLKN